MIPAFIDFDRFDYWLISWTTYGTWLPGDRRGYVSKSPEGHGSLDLLNRPRSPLGEPNEAWEGRARQLLKGKPIFLTVEMAVEVGSVLHEVCATREWQTLTFAIMRNHAHGLVGISVGTESNVCLRDFKAYASRKLNTDYGKPTSDTWWTTSGSRRWKRTWPAVEDSIRYIQHQQAPLVLWTNPELSMR